MTKKTFGIQIFFMFNLLIKTTFFFLSLQSFSASSFLTEPIRNQSLTARIDYKKTKQMTTEAKMSLLSAQNFPKRPCFSALEDISREISRIKIFGLRTSTEFILENNVLSQIDSDEKGIQIGEKTIYSSSLKGDDKKIIEIRRRPIGTIYIEEYSKTLFKTSIQIPGNEAWFSSSDRNPKIPGVTSRKKPSSKTLNISFEGGHFYLTKQSKGLIHINFSGLSHLQAFSIALAVL